MFFTYIVLSIGIYSLERQKPQMAEVSPVEEVQVVKSKPKTVEPVIPEFEPEDLTGEDNIIYDENNSEGENEEDFSNEELYEEIIFQDNFDKEYRDDVGDSYFEYPEDEEINTPEEIEEE